MLVVALTEGWIGIMFQGVDTDGSEMYKTRDKNVHMAIFFCLFIIIGTFFILNIFDGIVINAYNIVKLQSLGIQNYTHKQIQWIYLQNYITKIKLHTPIFKPKEKWR